MTVPSPADREEAEKAVAAAQRRYVEATEARRCVVRAAIRAGCSYRSVADAMGLTVSHVHKMCHTEPRPLAVPDEAPSLPGSGEPG